jgi:folate-binding protein YgfZ
MTGQDKSKNLKSINSTCSILCFSGNGVLEFLNNLLISDLTELDKAHYHYSAVCNPKGRIVSSLWINIKDDENICLICPIDMNDELLQYFSMRMFRLKIKISQAGESIFYDPESFTISSHKDSETALSANSDDAFYASLFSHNLPWIGAEKSEKFIPQHVNLDQHPKIMSFSKGCYPGQEIIARIKYLGSIKKRMCVLTDTDKNRLLEQIGDQEMVSAIIFDDTEKQFMVQIIESLRASNKRK